MPVDIATIAAGELAFLVLAQPVTEGIVARRLTVDGKRLVAANVPPLRHHSADGFDFGGRDGGSADLALAAVQMVLNRLNYLGPTRRLDDGSHVSALAWRLHGKFCAEFVAGAQGETLTIAWQQVMAWARREMLDFLREEKITLQGVLERWHAIAGGLPTKPPRSPMDQRDVLRDLGVEAMDLCGLVATLTHYLGHEG
ncbi:MAG: hypothetical protein HY328_12900 [Chloroflexi bacterium]|nr:hypothetical protein [Chloroflexota bacterium]